jgi:hypothetical protein
LRLEQTVKDLRAANNDGAKDDAVAKALEAKNKEISAIKSQAEGLQREYTQLADQYEALQKSASGFIQVPKKEL